MVGTSSVNCTLTLLCLLEISDAVKRGDTSRLQELIQTCGNQTVDAFRDGQGMNILVSIFQPTVSDYLFGLDIQNSLRLIHDLLH